MTFLALATLIIGVLIALALTDLAAGHWSRYCGHHTAASGVNRVVFQRHWTNQGRHWHTYRHLVCTPTGGCYMVHWAKKRCA